MERIIIEKSNMPLSRPIVYPSWYDSTNGIILAFTVLTAVILGRHEFEAMESSSNDIIQVSKSKFKNIIFNYH